jgi:hypothetical protein
MGQAGPQYHARYRAIDDAFRPNYERISAQQKAWRRGLGLTLSEFLFLDNFFEPLLKQLCQAPGFSESYRSDLIRRKATTYVNDWKAKESVGGIYDRIATEIGLFHFAAKRCRAFFEISTLNLGSSLTIRRYRDEWKRALYEVINCQRLE